MTSPRAPWRLALPLHAQLGEGLHWDQARQRLWMVDIHGRLVHRWALDAPTAESWAMPQRVGWVIPDGPTAVMLGLQEGVARTELGAPADELALEWMVRPFEDRPALRLNDAKRDGAGRVWFGSLNNDDESRADGALFRLEQDGAWAEVDTGYTVANGPAISPDGRTFLHTDSGRRTIHIFDLDPATGRLSGKRTWKVFTETEGYPDGMCFDAQGCVWVAHWGGACISRFDPDGRLLHRVDLPTRQITNVCFAGPGLDRLFVSSAAVGLDRGEEPLAGHLFEVFDLQGATGQPEAAHAR